MKIYFILICFVTILLSCENKVKYKNENSSISETTSFSSDMELNGNYSGEIQEGYIYESPNIYSASVVFNGNNEKGNQKKFIFTLYKNKMQIYSHKLYTFSTSEGEMLWAETGQYPKIFYFLKVEDGIIKIILSDENKNHLLKLKKSY